MKNQRIRDYMRSGWICCALAALLISTCSTVVAEQPPPPQKLYEQAAAQAQPGQYPEQLRGRQVYWTVLGVPRDPAESLLDEYGNLEATKGGSTLAPYVFTGNRLYSAFDAGSIRQELEGGWLPIPTVTWSLGALTLKIEAYALGNPDESATWIRYRLSNSSDGAQTGRLFLSIRPVQVNPPWQFGGISPIHSMSFAQTPERCEAQLNGATRYVSLTPADAFGVAAFDEGDVMRLLVRGDVPEASSLKQDNGLLSGTFAYDFNLEAGGCKEVVIAAPLHPGRFRIDAVDGSAAFEAGRSAVHRLWEEQLGGARILPSDQDAVRTIKAQLVYTLINKDDDALQPGSRHYERSWIRDGSVMAAALLRVGIHEPAREFADWYARFITPEGMVPPVFDSDAPADAGPGSEVAWDGQGEFAYLVMEYYRRTRDRAFLERHFDSIVRSLRFLEKLRNQTLAPDYMQGEPARERFVGILPKSVSHKGYRAELHVYWDDLWALKAWKDGKAAAEILGQPELAEWAEQQYQLLRASVRSSIEATIAYKKIDYIPGCAERGDFDPTSTSIAFFPCDEAGVFPEEQLKATYERYYRELTARSDPSWDGLFVTFEIRNVHAFLALGQKERAQYLLNYIMKCMRPADWRHLAAVVYGDPRTAGYIGDMPHTWAGADLIIALSLMQAPDTGD